MAAGSSVEVPQGLEESDKIKPDLDNASVKDVAATRLSGVAERTRNLCFNR